MITAIAATTDLDLEIYARLLLKSEKNIFKILLQKLILENGQDHFIFNVSRPYIAINHC